MSESNSHQAAEQRSIRKRNSDKPVLNLLGDRYSEWYLEFCQTGEATRSEVAEAFFAGAREAARRYVEAERSSRPDGYNGWRRDPESRMWMNKHLDERKAWAYAIDLLWQFSDGEDVDADALREALIRMSLRRHRQGRRGRNKEHIFVKAAGIVREKAALARMADAREDKIHEDYR